MMELVRAENLEGAAREREFFPLWLAILLWWVGAMAIVSFVVVIAALVKLLRILLA